MGVKCGEIYYVDLGEPRYDFGAVSNKEPAKRRPVVVLSINILNDQADKTIMLVCVVPGTKGANVPRDYATQVRVPANLSGLREETVFRAFQITAIHSRRIGGRPAGHMPGVYLEKLEQSVGFVLGISLAPKKS